MLGMKLFRAAALVGIGKKVLTEARKPENQARIRSAVDQAKQQVNKRRR